MNRRKVALGWLLLLAVGAVLLHGRYDWLPSAGVYARRAYFSSLYFFLLLVPMSYYFARALGARVGVARGITAVLFVAGALPYHWLGLTRYRQRLYRTWDPALFKLEWLQNGFTPGAPHERLMLVALVVVVAALLYATMRKAGWRRVGYVVALYAVIVVQAGLHTSVRSPHSYVPFIEGSAFYLNNLVPDHQGWVNADVEDSLSIDEQFCGWETPVHARLLRRPLVHYLAAPFSYLIPHYYVYLALNTLLWLGAALATGQLALLILGSREAAHWAALLTALGNGFIYFVAQPMAYLAGYSAVAVTPLALEVLLVGKERPSVAAAVLFGAVVGCALLTYDLFPLLPALLLYAWLRRASLRATGIALVIALAVDVGFLLVEQRLLKISLDSDNANFMTYALHQMWRPLLEPITFNLYSRALRFVVVCAQSLLFAFFGVGALLAAVGFVVASPNVRRLSLVMVLPTVLTLGALYFGGLRWGRVLMAELPRFFFGAYPAIYLLGAVALVRLRERLSARRHLAAAAPWVIVALVLALANADIFGFTEASYHFYWPTPIECRPYDTASCPPIY
jgi:hypothetical protein